MSAWADNQEILQNTVDQWDTIQALLWTECFIWGINPLATWIIALVIVILIGQIKPEIEKLVMFYNDE